MYLSNVFMAKHVHTRPESDVKLKYLSLKDLEFPRKLVQIISKEYIAKTKQEQYKNKINYLLVSWERVTCSTPVQEILYTS